MTFYVQPLGNLSAATSALQLIWSGWTAATKSGMAAKATRDTTVQKSVTDDLYRIDIDNAAAQQYGVTRQSTVETEQTKKRLAVMGSIAGAVVLGAILSR